jgi:hypothetical protein
MMVGLTAGLMLAVAAEVGAQSLGTFTWQQQPYCNLITVNVVQQGSVYQLDGYDDQCGAGTRASVTGMAFPNPNGTIGIGLTVVTTSSATAAPLHVSASLTLPSVSGTWKDSTGGTGSFVYYAGGAVTGASRPTPVTAFPSGLSVSNNTITNVAPPVNASDAATKGYVDGGIATTRSYALGLASRSRNFTAIGARSSAATETAYGCLELSTTSGTARLDLVLPLGARIIAVHAKYEDTSSDALSVSLRRVDQSTFFDLQSASITATAGTGVGTVDVPLFATPGENTVTATQAFYLDVSAPSHAGTLIFCGAVVDFALQ